MNALIGIKKILVLVNLFTHTIHFMLDKILYLLTNILIGMTQASFVSFWVRNEVQLAPGKIIKNTTETCNIWKPPAI